MPGINLVVSCTKRKTQPPQCSLQLRMVSESLSIQSRVAAWVKRIEEYGSNPIPARSLYSGDSWHVLRSIEKLPNQDKQPVRIWICSAGHGLIGIDTLLVSYSATFAPRQPDSVCPEGGRNTGSILSEWWNRLAEIPDFHSEPRTISELSKMYPDDFLLISLSDRYLRAVSVDLLHTIQNLPSPERMAIFSLGGSVSNELRPYQLPGDGRLQSLVSGSMSALNPRVARKLISELSSERMTRSRCRNQLIDWMQAAPRLVRPKRRVLTDAELKRFILRALKENPEARPTPLLRRLRETERACEHSRLVSLYRQLKEQQNGMG